MPGRSAPLSKTSATACSTPTKSTNIGAALASEHRLRVLNILVQREMSVDEVAEHLGQSKANTSIHLKVLHQAHLVSPRKDGKQVFYGIVGEPVLRLWMALRDTGLAELPEVRELMHRYAEEPETLAILENRAATPGSSLRFVGASTVSWRARVHLLSMSTSNRIRQKKWQ